MDTIPVGYLFIALAAMPVMFVFTLFSFFNGLWFLMKRGDTKYVLGGIALLFLSIALATITLVLGNLLYQGRDGFFAFGLIFSAVALLCVGLVIDAKKDQDKVGGKSSANACAVQHPKE